MPNSTMDEEHLLHCPKLNANQQMFRNTIKQLGCQSDDEITSPLSATGTTTTMTMMTTTTESLAEQL